MKKFFITLTLVPSFLSMASMQTYNLVDISYKDCNEANIFIYKKLKETINLDELDDNWEISLKWNNDLKYYFVETISDNLEDPVIIYNNCKQSEPVLIEREKYDIKK